MRCISSPVVQKTVFAFMISAHVVGAILTLLKQGRKVLRFPSCQLTFGLRSISQTSIVLLICFLTLIGRDRKSAFVSRSHRKAKMKLWLASANGMRRHKKLLRVRGHLTTKKTMLPRRDRCASFSKKIFR